MIRTGPGKICRGGVVLAAVWDVAKAITGLGRAAASEIDHVGRTHRGVCGGRSWVVARCCVGLAVCVVSERWIDV